MTQAAAVETVIFNSRLTLRSHIITVFQVWMLPYSIKLWVIPCVSIYFLTSPYEFSVSEYKNS